MSRNLDTAIRITAEVKGGGNIDRVKRSLQDLSKSSQVSARQIDQLFLETQKLSRASNGSVNALNQQKAALESLRNSVNPASRRFVLLSQDIARVSASLKEADAAAAGFGLAAALTTSNSAAAAGMVSFGGFTASTQSVAAALSRMGVSGSKASEMLRALQGDTSGTVVTTQKLNLALNQTFASTPEKAAAQINTMRQALAQLKIGSEDYLKALVRVNEAEAVNQARTGRASVIAANRAYSGPTMTSGYGSDVRLPGLPNTMAADMQRVSELTARVNNLDRATDEYRRSLQELEVVQRRLNARPERRSSGLREAAGGAAGVLAMGGGPMGAMGAAAGSMAAAGGPAGLAAAAGLAATAALTTQSVTAARALEEQSRRLRVMTADGDALQQSIISLTRDQGYLASTTEASAAAYEILQAGFSKNVDILKILEASTYGAAGGFTTIGIVADATTSILNGYGLTAQSAARIVDQMKAVTDDGKISMEAYSQSIGKVVPSAAAARLSLEEINGAIAALTAQGVPVETTFSGINQAIKTILKPTQEAKDLSKAIGLEFNSQALAAKGLGGFLADVAQKTGKSSDALSILFSDIDGYKAVVALLNDDLKRFNQFTENQASALGKASAAARIGIDPLKQYDNAWKDFSSTLGKAVLPALTGVTKAATGMLQAVLQGTEQLGKMAEEGYIFNPVTGEFQVVGGGKKPQRNQGPMGPAVPERLLRQPQKAAANPPNVAAALAAMDGGGGAATGAAKATEAAPQSNLNQLLIENLRLNTELGNVGKDRISQLNAEIELIPQILKLQLSALNASVKGQDLQQSRINAITEARARSAELENEREGVNKEVAGIAEQATLLRVSTLSGLLPKESPLKEAIRQVKTELLEADKAAEELLGRLSGLAGTNPASGAARAAIGNLRGDLATANPGEIASQRLVQGDVDALRQQVVELQNAGRDLSALDQLVLKYGEDWEQIDPKIRASLGALSEQKDKLEELNRVNERNQQLAEGVAGTIGGGLSSAMDLLIEGTDNWGNSLKEIAGGVLKDIARQLTQTLVIAPIVKGITKAFGFADGGIMSPSGPLPLKTYARGGIANSPQLALYGEGSMNEAYVPLPDGRRIPVALQGGSSGTTTQVVVNVDASGNSKVSGDAGQAEQLGRVVSQAVQAELIRQKRPGGLLA